MRRWQRLAALVMNIFILHLSVQAGYASCLQQHVAMDNHTQNAQHLHTAHSGHSKRVGVGESGEHSHQADLLGKTTSDEQSSGHKHSNHSGEQRSVPSPATHCLTMAGCAAVVTALAAPAVSSEQTTAIALVSMPAISGAHAGPAFPPDSPPPRA